MTDHDELVEDLRGTHGYLAPKNCPCLKCHAADAIESLTAENERLRRDLDDAAVLVAALDPEPMHARMDGGHQVSCRGNASFLPASLWAVVHRLNRRLLAEGDDRD